MGRPYCKKSIALLLLLATALLLPACAKKENESPPPSDVLDISTTPKAVQAEPLPVEGQSENMVDTGGNGETLVVPGKSYSPGQPASLEVKETIAYPLPGMLYGAAAYTNTGTAPIILTEAAFTFHFSGGTKQEVFAPLLSAYDIVAPGEIAYCTLWLPYAGDMPAALTLDASLKGETAAQDAPPFQVDSQKLIQNYPSFATLSGRVTNKGQSPCSLIMVSAGFYDVQGAFIGAWYFTRNVLLQPGNSAPFVAHMQSLPVKSLTEDTASIQCRAFPID